MMSAVVPANHQPVSILFGILSIVWTENPTGWLAEAGKMRSSNMTGMWIVGEKLEKCPCCGYGQRGRSATQEFRS
jgi:hypothetical protein